MLESKSKSICTYILITPEIDFIVSPDGTFELEEFIKTSGLSRSYLMFTHRVEYAYPTDVFPDDVFPMDPDDYPVDGHLMTPY